MIDPMPMRMQKATQGMLAMRMQRATRFAVRVPAAWLRKPSWLTERLQDPPLPRLPSAYKKTIGWLALCTSGLMSLASTYHLRASGTKAKQRTRTTRTYGPHQADRRRLQRCSCVHRWPAAWVDTPSKPRSPCWSFQSKITMAMIDYIERVNLSVLAARPRQQQCHSSSAQGRLQHKKKGWRRPDTQKTDTKKHKQNNKKEHKDWIVWGRQ